jgi:hypothetical protein
MKTSFLMMALIISLASCTKENAGPNSGGSTSGGGSSTGGGGSNPPTLVDTSAAAIIDPTALNLVPIITTGSWGIGSYTTPTENKTASFSKVTLTLTASLYGGTVTVNDGGKITSGSWTSQGIVYYGVPSSESVREWSFNLDKTYAKLNKSWLIRKITAKSVIFDSANPAELGTLVLTKK